MAPSKSNLPYTCKFVPIVGCADLKGCQDCGWNPDVAARRKNKLREDFAPKPSMEIQPKKRTMAVTWLERKK